MSTQPVEPRSLSTATRTYDEKHVSASTTPDERSESMSNEANAAAIKSAYRKINLRVIGWYCLVHFLFRLSSHNITSVAIMNREKKTDIQTELGHLTSEQWAWVISSYWFPFIAFEPLATLLLKKFGPRTWMGRTMLTWGTISMCQAACQSYAGIVTCRVLLGLAESGFYSGALYHIAFWIPTDMLAVRLAVLGATGYISGIISSFIAFGVTYMDGTAGLSGWQWMFIIEGAPSVLGAFYTMFYLPNYPHNSSVLTEEEKAAVIASVPDTQPCAENKTFNLHELKHALKDPTTYLFPLLYALHAVGAKGVMTALPTVILAMGLTGTAVTQLMQIPAYFVGFWALLWIGYLIRKKKVGPWTMALTLTGLCGSCYLALVFVEKPVARYLVIILAMISSVGFFPAMWPERIRVAEGTTNAGFAIGTTNAAASLVGLVGTQLYQESMGPRYRISFSVSTALLGLNIIVVSFTWVLVRRRLQKQRTVTDSETTSNNGGVLQSKE